MEVLKKAANIQNRPMLNVGTGLSPCRRPSGRRVGAETNRRSCTDRASFVTGDAERKLGGTLEKPKRYRGGRESKPRACNTLPPSDLATGRTACPTVAFITVRGPQAHRDSAEALAPQKRCGLRHQGRFRERSA